MKKLIPFKKRIISKNNKIGSTFIVLLLFLLAHTVLQAQQYVQIGNDIDGQITSEASGLATSLSHDGSRIAVGSNFMGNNGLSPGLVRVYELDGGTWTQVGADIVGENMDDEFGTSVHLNHDGTVVVIGAPENDDAADTAGMVRVYELIGGQWSQMGQDIDGVDVNERFGYSVDISFDGSRIIAGSLFGRTNGVITGDARVYEFSNGSWSQLGDDLGSTTQDNYGRSVAMNAPGTRVAVAGPLNDTGGFNLGKTEIFELDNGVWTQMGATIFGTEESGASGWSISLNEAGNAIAIGAPANGDPIVQGAAKVYQFSGGDWNQLGTTIAGTNPISAFADSVSLSDDGARVVVGDPLQGPNGLTRVFSLSAGTWTQIGPDIVGEAQGDLSGRSVSISADGLRISMGANVNSDGAPGGGQARVFEDTLLSVDDVNGTGIAIYVLPNPARNFITIQSQSNITFEGISLYDMQGRLVSQVEETAINNETRLDVSHIAAGNYLIRIKTAQGEQNLKLIKN